MKVRKLLTCHFVTLLHNQSFTSLWVVFGAITTTIHTHGRPSIYLGWTWSKLLHGVTESIYSEAMHWKINLFMIPYGPVGKSFNSKLAHYLGVLLSHRQLNQLPWGMPQLYPYYSCKSQLGNQQQKTTVSVSSNGWIYGALVTSLIWEGRTIQQRIPKIFHQ